MALIAVVGILHVLRTIARVYICNGRIPKHTSLAITPEQKPIAFVGE